MATERYLAWHQANADGTDKFGGRSRPLTDEQWNEFQIVTSIIPELRPIVIDFLCVERDFAAIGRLRDDIVALNPNPSVPMRVIGKATLEARSLVQHGLSNFINAAHGFRERTAARIRNRYGADSDAFRHITDVYKTSYDRSFAYRLMSNLRNRAQWYESRISLTPVDERTEDETLTTTGIGVSLRKSSLLRDESIEAPFRSEIEQIDSDRFDVIEVANAYMTEINAIMFAYLDSHVDRLQKLSSYRQAVYTMRYMPPAATPIIWEGEIPKDEEPNASKVRHFGFGELEFVHALYKRLAPAAD